MTSSLPLKAEAASEVKDHLLQAQEEGNIHKVKKREKTFKLSMKAKYYPNRAIMKAVQLVFSRGHSGR